MASQDPSYISPYQLQDSYLNKNNTSTEEEAVYYGYWDF